MAGVLDLRRVHRRLERGEHGRARSDVLIGRFAADHGAARLVDDARRHHFGARGRLLEQDAHQRADLQHRQADHHQHDDCGDTEHLLLLDGERHGSGAGAVRQVQGPLECDGCRPGATACRCGRRALHRVRSGDRGIGPLLAASAASRVCDSRAGARLRAAAGAGTAGSTTVTCRAGDAGSISAVQHGAVEAGLARDESTRRRRRRADPATSVPTPGRSRPSNAQRAEAGSARSRPPRTCRGAGRSTSAGVVGAGAPRLDRLLVGVRHRNEPLVAPRRPEQFEADRDAVGGEARRHRHRRETRSSRSAGSSSRAAAPRPPRGGGAASG